MTNQISVETQLHSVLSSLGFKQPTEVQRQAIPVLAQGESVLALAPTGSGKTLSFLIPLMEKLDPSTDETQLLVLAPTRELGHQIAQVAHQVAACLTNPEQKQLQIRSVFGGQKAESQKTELLKNPAVVVATPGRALELIEKDVLKIAKLRAIVLDEADVMVGMGFEAQVKAICDFLPTRIQAALFSATESEGQSRLQNRLVHRGKRIDVRQNQMTVEGDEDASKMQTVLHQTVVVSGRNDRLSALSNVLRSISNSVQTGIVFCQTRESVQQVSEFLNTVGFSAAGLSGELGQIERATIMRRFKAGGVKYLVATNLASRGIDVCDLSVVVNFELPSTQQEYLHRSGRSGRAGKNGWTISLCTPQSKDFLHDVLQGTGIKLQSLQVAADDVAPTEPVQQFKKIHVNRGKSSKLRAGDFLGALTQGLGLGRDHVGGIFIFDHFTHIEIAQSQESKVLSQLSGCKIKNMLVKVTKAQELTAPRGRHF